MFVFSYDKLVLVSMRHCHMPCANALCGRIECFTEKTMLIISAPLYLFVCVFQFSGQCADEMRKTYAEFCSGHLKAVKLYKELLARDKRLQYFIRVRAKRKIIIVVSLISHSSMFFFSFILNDMNLFNISFKQTCLCFLIAFIFLQDS